MKKFIQELQRRNVIKAAISYIALSLVLLEGFDIIFPFIGVPAASLRYIFFILLTGFPAWVVFAYVYELTPSGFKKTDEVAPSASIYRATGKRLNVFIVGGLLLVVVLLVADRMLNFTGGFDATIHDKSIAVLPFVNMSDDSEQEYFSDGLSEELLNQLAKIPLLKVIGRTSSFAFKGKNEDLREIGKKLGVSYLLEGSVRKSGNILRITAQLINVADGYHIFSETYDRELKDIFAIQDEISRAILDAIKIELLGAEKESVYKRYTDNVEAHEFYLKGRFQYNLYTPDNLIKAIEYFEAAINLEPKYAIAYSSLSFCYLSQWYWNYLPPEKCLPQGLQAAHKALELDDNIAESHLAIGRVKLHYEWNIEEAFIAYKKSLALKPNCAECYVQLGMCAVLLGNSKEAIEYSDKAIELDPFSPLNLWSAALMPFFVGDMDKTIEQGKKLIDLSPDFWAGHMWVGNAYIKLGRYQEGMTELQTAANLENGAFTMSILGVLYGSMGNKEKANEIIEKIKSIEGIEIAGNNFIADVYGSIGELDSAFMHYDKAIENHEGNMLWKQGLLRNLPGFSEDPRTEKIYEKMGIPNLLQTPRKE